MTPDAPDDQEPGREGQEERSPERDEQGERVVGHAALLAAFAAEAEPVPWRVAPQRQSQITRMEAPLPAGRGPFEGEGPEIVEFALLTQVELRARASRMSGSRHRITSVRRPSAGTKTRSTSIM
jgi:hypothetical protein